MKLFFIILCFTTSTFAFEKRFEFRDGNLGYPYKVVYELPKLQECLEENNQWHNSEGAWHLSKMETYTKYSPCSKKYVEDILVKLYEQYFWSGRTIAMGGADKVHHIEFIEFMLSFVNSLPYEKEDHSLTDHWKTPFETIVAGQGDCEDHALLFSALLSAAGFENAILVFPKHAAVGIKMTPWPSNRFKFGEYYPCETTGNNNSCGVRSSVMEGSVSIKPMTLW